MTTEERTTQRSPAGDGNGARPARRPRRARARRGLPRPSPLLRLAGVSLVIVVAATALAIVANELRSPEYGAESYILYRLDDPSGGRAERELATQQVILQGRQVLQPIAGEAGMTVEDLQEQLAVDIVGTSDVLRLRVGNTDPTLAVELTEQIATSYVEDQLDTLEEGNRARSAEVRILTPAYLLEDPISPGPLQAGAAGMMLGLLVAGVLVAVRLQRLGYYQ